jgi:hypothetical protein
MDEYGLWVVLVSIIYYNITIAVPTWTESQGMRGLRVWDSQSYPGALTPNNVEVRERDANGGFLQISKLRWYPGTALLADGRVLIIQGGTPFDWEFGNKNDLEVLPMPEGILVGLCF